MKSIRLIALVFLFSAALAQAASAMLSVSVSVQAATMAKNHSWCSPKDVVGAWAMVYFQERPPGDETRTSQELPYGYLFFTDDWRMMLLRSNQPMTDVKNAASIMQAARSGAMGLNYQLGQDGKMVFALQKKPFSKLWCQVVPATSKSYHKGDIILTSGDGSSSVTHVYRRILLP